MPRLSHRLALAGAVTATAALTPGLASATAASGVSAVVTGKSTILGTDYVRRQITIEPGGSTGWHWDEGVQYIYIEQGSLTHNDATCTTTDVLSQNTSFEEPGGADAVQIERNLGTVPLVMDVLTAVPAGSPLSHDAPNPGCAFG